jgi:competence protein ComEC
VVETYKVQNTGSSYFYLSSVKLGGQRINGRVCAFIDKYDGTEAINFSTGSCVKFETRINPGAAAIRDINNRIRYTANVDFKKIEITGQSRTVRHTILRYAYNFYNKYMSPENASLLYSMTFGDRNALDDDINASFAVAGLTHVLAVSGLHVGILVMMLLGVLKLCRVRAKYRFFIIFCVLLFYCYLSDFRFSILRACIMFLTILFMKLFLRRVDMLSNLCFAGILTLIFFPHALWSWSFQLSYACMFGIALFYTPINGALEKLIIPHSPNWLEWIQRKILGFIAIYFCVLITTWPFLIKYFGSIPVFGIITSVIFMPILVLAFQMGIIALVTWVGQFLLYAADPFVTFVRAGVNWISHIPFAQINASNDGWWLLFYLTGIILCTRFVFAPKKIRYSAALCLFAVYMIGFFV